MYPNRLRHSNYITVFWKHPYETEYILTSSSTVPTAPRTEINYGLLTTRPELLTLGGDSGQY